MSKNDDWKNYIVLIILLFVCIVAVITWIEMLLWNWVVVALGGPKITFWQMFGLSLLISLLTYKPK